MPKRFAAFKNIVSYNNHINPQDENSQLKAGEIVFRKRQSFNVNMNKKLQVKIIAAFKVLKRVGTGLYKLKDVVTGNEVLLPICQLIRSNLTELEVIDIINQINNDF